MCRKIITGILVVIAIIFASVALLLLSLRWQLLNSRFYKNTLAEAGSYQLITDVTTTAIHSYIVSGLGGQNNTGDKKLPNNPKLNLLLQNEKFRTVLADNVVNYLKNDLGMQQLLHDTLEKNIDNVMAWADGSSQEIILYVPKTVLEKKLSNEVITKLVADALAETANLANLPTCTTEELFNLLLDINKIDISSLTCTHPEIIKQLENGVKVALFGSQGNEANLLETIFPAGLAIENNLIPLNTLLRDNHGTISSLATIKQGITISTWILLLAFLVSLLAAFAAVLFSLGNKVSTFFRIYFIAGVIILLTGVFAGFVLPELLGNSVNVNVNLESNLTADPAVTKEIAELMKNLVTISMAKLFTAPLIAGGFLVLMNSLMLLIFRLFEGRHRKKPDNISPGTVNPIQEPGQNFGEQKPVLVFGR